MKEIRNDLLKIPKKEYKQMFITEAIDVEINIEITNGDIIIIPKLLGNDEGEILQENLARQDIEIKTTDGNSYVLNDDGQWKIGEFVIIHDGKEIPKDKNIIKKTYERELDNIKIGLDKKEELIEIYNYEKKEIEIIIRGMEMYGQFVKIERKGDSLFIYCENKEDKPSEICTVKITECEGYEVNYMELYYSDVWYRLSEMNHKVTYVDI